VAYSQGIPLKKQFGQHFLRDHSVIETMISAVEITDETSVFEIGCGDGFLTKEILNTSAKRLFIFEIDPDWATYVQNTFPDERLSMFQKNFLDIDLSLLQNNAPWTMLSNLPYQVTFPILHTLQENRHLLKEGVIMVQEEVAQKIVKTRGKGFGYSSLFFQYYFEWRLLVKVPPTAFHPAPKVFSRLLYFKPKQNIVVIPEEEGFWKFIKQCFKQPRRTLKNNLEQTHYRITLIDANILGLRAQEISINDFIALWELIRS